MTLMEGEELSISLGKEGDYLLHQNIGYHLVNSFEFIESHNNLDCKGIIYLVQSSVEYFQWFHNLGNPFQCLTIFMGKVISSRLDKISCCNLWLLPIVVLLHASGKSDSILPMPGQMSLNIIRTLKIMGKETWFHPSMLYSFAWNVVLPIPVPTGT